MSQFGVNSSHSLTFNIGDEVVLRFDKDQKDTFEHLHEFDGKVVRVRAVDSRHQYRVEGYDGPIFLCEMFPVSYGSPVGNELTKGVTL